MLIIGENIHILSADVKEAIANRDAKLIQDMALRQVAAGAGVIDLNIGPQKRHGAEIMPWVIEAVQAVTDTPLALDTTNVAAMEAGLQVCKKPALLNSTSADPERLRPVMELAAKYHARVIALTMGVDGIPPSADGRAALAMEVLLPTAAELGIPMPDVFLDPLVLTVMGNQDVTTETVDAIRIFKQLSDPAPTTTAGLSNISNGAPPELRPLINRMYLVMLMGAGLDTVIADACDEKLMEWIRIVENRDDSTKTGKLVLALYDATAAMDSLEADMFNMDDSEEKAFYKTYRILRNQIIYAHSYIDN